jgi:hypothetical protein
LIYYARNELPRELAQYMSVLAKSGPEAAWQAAFSARESTLDKDIYAFLKQNHFRKVTIEVPLEAPAIVRVQALDEGATSAVLQRLDALQKAPRTDE